MNKFSRPVCIVILACLPVIGILYAKSPADSKRAKQKVLVEAMIVQVSGDTLDKLQIGRYLVGPTVVGPSEVAPPEVTVPLATLLYVLADPNAVNVIAKQKLLVYAGQTGKLTTGQKLKYLVKKDDGSFEQKTTDKPIGTTFEATPFIDKDGDILLAFKFQQFSVAPPKEVDPQTSLPIGEPIIGVMGVDSDLTKFKLGEPMIVGGMITPWNEQFVLVRADVLEQPAEAK